MAHKPDAKKTEEKHAHLKGAAKKRECQVKGCKNEYRAKGYCDRHYRLWKSGAFGDSRYRACSKENCNKPVSKAGLCETHWTETYAKSKGGEAAAAAPAG